MRSVQLNLAVYSTVCSDVIRAAWCAGVHPVQPAVRCAQPARAQSCALRPAPHPVWLVQ